MILIHDLLNLCDNIHLIPTQYSDDDDEEDMQIHQDNNNNNNDDGNQEESKFKISPIKLKVNFHLKVQILLVQNGNILIMKRR